MNLKKSNSDSESERKIVHGQKIVTYKETYSEITCINECNILMGIDNLDICAKSENSYFSPILKISMSTRKGKENLKNSNSIGQCNKKFDIKMSCGQLH